MLQYNTSGGGIPSQLKSGIKMKIEHAFHVHTISYEVQFFSFFLQQFFVITMNRIISIESRYNTHGVFMNAFIAHLRENFQEIDTNEYNSFYADAQILGRISMWILRMYFNELLMGT